MSGRQNVRVGGRRARNVATALRLGYVALPVIHGRSLSGVICPGVVRVLTQPTYVGKLAIWMRAVSSVVGDADRPDGVRGGIPQGIVWELRSSLASFAAFSSAPAFARGAVSSASS